MDKEVQKLMNDVNNFERAAKDLADHLSSQRWKVGIGIATSAILCGFVGFFFGLLASHPLLGAGGGLIGSLLYSGYKLRAAAEERRKFCLRAARGCGIFLPDGASEKQIRAAYRKQMEAWSPRL